MMTIVKKRRGEAYLVLGLLAGLFLVGLELGELDLHVLVAEHQYEHRQVKNSAWVSQQWRVCPTQNRASATACERARRGRSGVEGISTH